MSSPMEELDHLDRSESETVRRHAATFRRARLARLAAVEAERDRRSDAAPPMVACRRAGEDEVPAAARRFSAAAEAAGWRVAVTYARGPVAGGGVQSVAVRCRAGSRYACGLWRSPMPSIPRKPKWAFAAGVVSDAGGPRVVGAKELAAYLSLG